MIAISYPNFDKLILIKLKLIKLIPFYSENSDLKAAPIFSEISPEISDW